MFAALNLAYFGAAELYSPAYRKQVELDEFLEAVKPLRIGYFGDSQMADGMATGPDTFNFSSRRETPIETYYKLKYLVEQAGLKMKSAVFEFELHMFIKRPKRSAGQPFSPPRAYSRMIDLPTLARLRGSSVPETAVMSVFPLLGSGFELVQWLVHRPLAPEVRRGWYLRHGQWSPKSLVASTGEKFEQQYGSFTGEIDEDALAYFLKSLQLALKSGARVYLVSMPVTREFMGRFDKLGISRGAALGPILSRIRGELGNVVHLDFHAAFPDDRTRFRNANHLNYRGSVELELLLRQASLKQQ